jgi:SAM-dependent methyltransferase
LKKAEYARMAEREQTYWWHIGRFRIMESYLGLATKGAKKQKTKILNIGCGTGGTIKILEQFGSVENVDVSDDAIKLMKKAGYSVTKVSGIKLPFKEATFNVVGAFDVLEHIDEDVAALAEWMRVLKPGGKVVLTVPAYKWLWSEHDTSLHHHRRHTRKGIKQRAVEAGLDPVKVSYAIVFSLPLVVGFRWLNKLLGRKTDGETSYVNVPNWLNTVFTKLLFIEAWFHKYISFPFGTSVVAILEKKEK